MGFVSSNNNVNVLRGLNSSQKTEVILTGEFVVEMDNRRWQAVEECKERFLRDEESPYNSPYMYPEIAASWIRSKKNGIDPYAKNLGYNLKPRELSALIRDKHAMIDITGEFMQKHLGLLSSSGYFMCLTDENGILLLCAGGKTQVEFFERINGRPGSVWNEETIGTNCHSLCISLKKPVQLIGPYYYCRVVYDNIGSGTPILDENGEVMGVLLVVDATIPEKQVKQTHLLGWVVSAGLAIESQLKLRKNSYYLGLANRTVETTIEAIGEGCITLDKQGFINHINREGADLFVIDESEARGKHFSELFKVEIPVGKVLADGNPIKELKAIVNSDLPDQSHIIDIEPIFNDESDVPDGVFIRLALSAAKFNKVKTKSKESKEDSFASLRGESKAFKDTIYKARKIAHSDGGVLLIGDSGTGKELFAHAIHNEYRPEGSFVAINCTALPRGLIESELFGYEGGSFTGADRGGRMGKIELANGGTLFLDEIGDMPLEVQPVLLRVLEDKKVMRIGCKKHIPVDFRVIAATNKDLLEMVEAKKFRQDLYYRLAVFKLNIPSLQERKDDILKLAEFFIEQACNNAGVSKIPQLSLPVREIFLEYDWPGNVRQLENAVTYALVMATDDMIKVEDLPEEILQSSTKYKHVSSKKQANDDQVSSSIVMDGKIVLDATMSMQEIEKIAVENTLNTTGYNIPLTANILGMARSTLYRKMKEYNINF